MEVTKLESAGAMPEIEVIFGSPEFGKYQLTLWDNTGHNPVQIGSGVNKDNLPDKFSIGNLGTLNGRLLSWEVIIAAFNTEPGSSYSVTIKITQDSEVAENGEFEYTGSIDGVALVADSVELQVQ